jgi:hypothetical protein
MVVLTESDRPRKRANVLVSEAIGHVGEGRERLPSKTRAGCRGWVVMVTVDPGGWEFPMQRGVVM